MPVRRAMQCHSIFACELLCLHLTLEIGSGGGKLVCHNVAEIDQIR